MQCKITTVSIERKGSKRGRCEVLRLLPGEDSIQLYMKEAAFYFTPPYRINDIAISCVREVYISWSQPHRRHLPASLNQLQPLSLLLWYAC